MPPPITPVSPLLIRLISGFKPATPEDVTPDSLLLVEVIENGVSTLKHMSIQTIVDQISTGVTRSIVDIVLHSSEGPLDTYRINYTDHTYDTFTVKNGIDGSDVDLKITYF